MSFLHSRGAASLQGQMSSWETSLPLQSSIPAAALHLGCCFLVWELLSALGAAVCVFPSLVHSSVSEGYLAWMEPNGCSRSCKPQSLWNKTHQPCLSTRVVIAGFPRHYPHCRDLALPPLAGSAGAGCQHQGKAGPVPVAVRGFRLLSQHPWVCGVLQDAVLQVQCGVVVDADTGPLHAPHADTLQGVGCS